MELIDRQNATSVLEILADKCADTRAFEQAIGVLRDVPTIEAEPVKHGRWVWRGGNLYECSECEAIVVAQDYIPIELHKFCRGCGAKMEGGENG